MLDAIVTGTTEDHLLAFTQPPPRHDEVVCPHGGHVVAYGQLRTAGGDGQALVVDLHTVGSRQLQRVSLARIVHCELALTPCSLACCAYACSRASPFVWSSALMDLAMLLKYSVLGRSGCTSSITVMMWSVSFVWMFRLRGHSITNSVTTPAAHLSHGVLHDRAWGSHTRTARWFQRSQDLYVRDPLERLAVVLRAIHRQHPCLAFGFGLLGDPLALVGRRGLR